MIDAQTVEARLAAIGESEAHFYDTVGNFNDEDLEAPSLCEGWSRGHVIGHVALNAHSIVNLITWARTGEETPQYPSWEARDADIQTASEFTVEEHLQASKEASEALREAAVALPLDRWDFVVRGIGGREQPVANYLTARLNEVEIHHVDLGADYDSKDWLELFVRDTLNYLPERLGEKADPAFELDATDLGLRLRIGDGASAMTISGLGHALLKWAIGRSDGSGLTSDRGYLPPIPTWG